ncbi:TPA_asm: tail completion or Neck1 protein [Caudoviricetes sp. vir519]|nr:TPA_asm: tail completion or Neck1 protein [Caudoviricetes sp. vir519]
MKLRVDISGLDELRKTLRKADELIAEGFENCLYYLLQEGNRRLTEGAHVISGNLIRTGDIRTIMDTQGEVFYTAPYASYVHDGTKQHEIRAVRKKALRFKMQNVVVFARKVQHPGTLPVKFLYECRDWDEMIEKVKKVLLNPLLEGLNG